MASLIDGSEDSGYEAWGGLGLPLFCTEIPVTVMYDSCGMCGNAVVLISSDT